MRRFLTLSLVVFALTACASSPPRQQRSEFEDIPVPKGLTLDSSKSTVIESPNLKAARLVYKGRVEADSLGAAFRTTLEANGWRHLTSTTSSDKGTTQVYEKAGNSLQVMIYEGIYYTWVEVSATRVVSASAAASTPVSASTSTTPMSAPAAQLNTSTSDTGAPSSQQR